MSRPARAELPASCAFTQRSQFRMQWFSEIVTAAAFLIVTANPCLALWEIALVSKEPAKEMGMEVRSHAAGPVEVRVDLEYKPQGELKDVREVNLRINDGGRTVV